MIAFRNMDHRFVTRVALGISDWIDPDCEDRIFDKMLLDQGMDQTQENRWVLGWASRASWEVYMCLLYAGIEQYRNVSRDNPDIRFDPLEDYLQRNKKLVEHLRNIRDKLLHPLKSTDYPDNLREIGIAATQTYPDLFLALEHLQNQLDDFLGHFRDILNKSLGDEIENLPGEEMVAYFHAVAQELTSLTEASTSVGAHTSMRCWLDLLEGIEQLLQLDPGSDLALTGAQLNRVNFLKETQDALSPHLPKRPFQKSNDSVQTPVVPQLSAWVLLSSFGGRVAELEERLPSRVLRHRSGLLELLIRSITIYNETHVAIESRFREVFPNVPFENLARNEELWQEASRQSIPTESNADLERAMLEVAPFSIALALLTEPLRIYHQSTQQRPEFLRREIDNDALDKTLRVFSGLRNTVFHVPHGQTNVFSANEVMAHASTSHGDYLDIVAGLVQFFQAFDFPMSQQNG